MSDIGHYLVRVGEDDKRYTLAHYIESEIADRVIARCGREMHRRNDDGVMREASGTDRTCFWCVQRADRAPERVEDVPEPVAVEQDDWSPV